ncbi:hypothetical protein BC833DRAFT_648841 [Globomyces pollinis-pini]|nr:hypothetical protein BC833DRAFT_648841 [Globomyces pollinis-pini]
MSIQKQITESVLILSLILGAHNIYVSAKAVKAINRNFGSLVNIAQAVASIFQFLNQGFLFLFLNLDAIKDLNGQCWLYQEIDFICFILFQFLSIGVLIFRTTVFLSKRTQLMTRCFLYLLLIGSITSATHSSINRVVFIDNDGHCAAIWYGLTNNMKIYFNLFNYSCILGMFIYSAYLLGSNVWKQARLRDVIKTVSFGVIIAIVGYLISGIFALAGVWGTSFQIEFSLENYCSILASTHQPKPISQEPESDWKSNKKTIVVTKVTELKD